MIKGLEKNYPEYLIGYSDHTLPCENMLTLTSAYLLGAVIIEKHFTHDKNLPGNDHYHAMDKNDLMKFKDLAKKIHDLNGNKLNKEYLPSESISRKNARRSIVANKNLAKGELINENNITCKRPGSGITPMDWDKLIGRKLKNAVPYDQLLRWEDIE